MILQERINLALKPTGLIRLGTTPISDPDLDARHVVMIGNAGPDMWRIFASEQERNDGEPHSLNRWTRRVLSSVADNLELEILFPFDGPPYYPFQRWMISTHQAFQSPIGLLIHNDFGLWFALRGALLVREHLPVHASTTVSPCTDCEAKPCLSTCPVDAFSPGGYDVPSCKAHLTTKDGTDCMDLGCEARRACPIGKSFHYSPDQARLHMEAFRD